KVDAEMPSIVVVAKDASGATLTLARLAIDGADAAVPAEGKSLPLDPGGHDVHVEVEGAPPMDKHVELARGAKGVRVELAVASAWSPSRRRPSSGSRSRALARATPRRSTCASSRAARWPRSAARSSRDSEPSRAEQARDAEGPRRRGAARRRRRAHGRRARAA